MAINPNNVLHLVVGDVASNDLMGSTFKKCYYGGQGYSELQRSKKRACLKTHHLEIASLWESFCNPFLALSQKLD